MSELDPDDESGIGTLDTLLTRSVDGIVLFPSIVGDLELELFAKTCGCPVVMIGRPTLIRGVVSIALDEASAAQLTLRHSIGRGKRRVGLLMNESFPETIYTRYEALRCAIEAATGQSVPPVEAAKPNIDQAGTPRCGCWEPTPTSTPSSHSTTRWPWEPWWDAKISASAFPRVSLSSVTTGSPTER